MKQLSKLLLIGVLLIISSVCFASCSVNDLNNAKNIKWLFNENYHWHSIFDNSSDSSIESHSWDKGVITTPACSCDGIRTYTCTVCGMKKTEVAHKNEHELSTVCSDENHHWYKCAFCDVSSTKQEHTWNLTTIIVSPTCVSDGIGQYTCDCGQTKTATIEKDSNAHKYSQNYSTIDSNCHLNCLTCEYCHHKIQETETHTWDNGDFIFNDRNDYSNINGTWIYTCSCCGTVKTQKGIMAREGDSLYAYNQLQYGKFYDGSEFNIEGRQFTNYSLIPLAQEYYREMFEECEKILDSTLDYDNIFCTIQTADINKNSINDIKSDQVAIFFREITCWFAGCAPSYYFLNPYNWSYGYTNHIKGGRFLTKYRISLSMYPEFNKYSDRQQYQSELDEMTETYKTKFSSYTDERSKVKAIYNETCDLIKYSNLDTPCHNSLAGMTIGQGVCECYAQTFMYLCHLNGIEALMVYSDGHAFNIAKINNVWYWFDACWGDNSENRKEYFGTTTPSQQPVAYWFPLMQVSYIKLAY